MTDTKIPLEHSRMHYRASWQGSQEQQVKNECDPLSRTYILGRLR
jgi:hypothetical protein